MMLRQIFIVISAFVFSLSSFAHDAHTSTTEMEWNQDSQRFEVAMRLRISDLEDAISLQQKSRFRLESDRERDIHLHEYLRRHFEVTLNEDRKCQLHWAGCELELHDVWIYFEAESIADDVTSQSAAAVQAGANRVGRWSDLFGVELASKARAMPSAVATVSIRSTLLLKVQPEQVNVVSLTRGKSTTVVTLSHESTTASF